MRPLSYYDNAKIGDEVCWQTINGEQRGTVKAVNFAGVHVAVKGGGDMILTTRDSMRFAWERKGRPQYRHINP